VPFELKDDLQLSSTQCPAEQLITITILLIASNLIVGKETFNRFVKGHSVSDEFVPLEIVLDVRRTETMPIDHGGIEANEGLSQMLDFRDPRQSYR
jgi:hypothetical protein